MVVVGKRATRWRSTTNFALFVQGPSSLARDACELLTPTHNWSNSRKNSTSTSTSAGEFKSNLKLWRPTDVTLNSWHKAVLVANYCVKFKYTKITEEYSGLCYVSDSCGKWVPLRLKCDFNLIIACRASPRLLERCPGVPYVIVIMVNQTV